MTATRFVVCVLVTLAACRGDDTPEEPKLRSAAVAPSTNPSPNTPAASDPTAKKNVDKKKGDKSDEEWVPAEFKTGAARWKDTGVYLDGKPIGFLTWGELPIGLQPTWVKDKVSANKRPGSKDLGWRWAQQRRYRFTDYLTAMGIDVAKVKELHVYGPRFSNSVVATTQDLLSPAAANFQFRFGGNTSGKAIPQTPDNFGHGNPPDKIAAVMIYIEKKPPTLTNEGFDLDGLPQEAVPYYGEPLRGGIRIYKDNRLAAYLKRQELDPKLATKAANGELSWKLADFLKSQGVDISDVAEMWVIRDERRTEKFTNAEVASLAFQAAAQAKGGIQIGDKLVRANAIALHTKPVAPTQMPFTTADDD
ncbi:MAG TPA: hypothetical protein VK427_05350 [Kofleriaceae bacterium]|nr:hypothetical protein [Kofleriaceae bacterium]